MIDDLIRGTLLHNVSPIHEDDLICHISGKGHLVGNDDHGGLFVCEGTDDTQHLTGFDQFGNGDDAGQGGVFDQGDDLVGHGRNDPFDDL